MNRKYTTKAQKDARKGASMPKTMSSNPLDVYRNGGDGFVKWAEDFLYVKITPVGELVDRWVPIRDLPVVPHPVTGRSYRDLWENQKTVLREALVMDNEGLFKHRLIIFDWFRGEGKSALVCMIVAWRFFVFPNQKIVLGANSKDQTKFVHYDIVRDQILNSPRLLDIVGRGNVMEKEIQMTSPSGDIISFIRPISSFSGIVSNITCYTFSEMFDMRNPRFFTQLDGSIRNVPNAFGLIDSTVADEDHILTKLETGALAGLDPTTFVSYRFSPEADQGDFWHPYNTQQQLNSYKIKFTTPEFDRYFRNVRPSSNNRVFNNAVVEAMGYIGMDDKIGGVDIVMAVNDKHAIIQKKDAALQRAQPAEAARLERQIESMTTRFKPLETIYRLTDPYGFPRMASCNDLELLGDVLCTEWCIGAGVDRADPTAMGNTTADTIMTVVAKGLPGSRGKLFAGDEGVPEYVYFIMHVTKIDTSAMEDIKYELLRVHEEFDGLDTICSEKWGMFDLGGWCESRDIAFECLSPSYNIQRGVFTEMSTAMSSGRLKCPIVAVPGRKKPDILREQFGVFIHDTVKKLFCSPEKILVGGIQDDVVYATGYGIHGLREKTAADFRRRSGRQGFWGVFIPGDNLLGKY